MSIESRYSRILVDGDLVVGHTLADPSKEIGHSVPDVATDDSAGLSPTSHFSPRVVAAPLDPRGRRSVPNCRGVGLVGGGGPGHVRRAPGGAAALAGNKICPICF